MMEFIRFKRGQQQARYARLEPQFEGNAFLPQYALIPLSFQTHMSTLPLVSIGDPVTEGQVIARAGDSTSVHVHASVPGIVTGFIDSPLPNGQFFRGIHIRTDGVFDMLGKQRNPYPWRQSDQMTLLHFFDLAGLVNTARGVRSLADTLRNAIKKGTRKLTVMLYDTDPTCMLDSFLTRRFPHEIAEGICIVARALEASSITIEMSADKKDRMLSEPIAAALSGYEVNVLTVPPVYPPESTQTLIAENGGVLIDATTVLSVYECAKYNQPMMTVYLLLTGNALEHARVIKVRIGTPIGRLIEECGGFKTKNTHIIINGLLGGSLVDSLDLPIGKGIKSVHAVGKDIKIQKQLDECGHCGQCFRSCPACIDPITTVRAIRKDRYTAEVRESIAACRGCGCCSAVCPARIPLCTIIKSAAAQGVSHAV
ncbi:MAG: 4Fe-4S dicluster domain-containing protein [Treponema sp.]|uniref:4Fe-4S dicluster domain-containing protein n=1 Tax=Treponema sp. TaxID=166 RepID=UPI003FA22096